MKSNVSGFTLLFAASWFSGCSVEATPQATPPPSTATVEAALIGEPLDTGAVNGSWVPETSPATLTSSLGLPAACSALSSDGATRLIGIQVAQVSPLLLTVTTVQNSGTFKRAWSWCPDLTAEQLQLYTTVQRARPVSLDAYVLNGALHFAAVMVSNSGTEAQGWWYAAGSLTNIESVRAQNNARLVDFRQYPVGNGIQYVALMVANTGPDATPSWYYPGLTGTQVNANLVQNGAFLVSSQPADANGNTFNVIMNQFPDPGVTWTAYGGITDSEMTQFLGQKQSRPVDVKSYHVNGQRVYDVIMLGNTFTTAQQSEAACDANVVAGWATSTPATGMGTAATVQKYDDIFKPMVVQNGIPGVSVAVIKNGKLVLARAYGFSDQQQVRIAHPDNLFRLASISKPITAVAILWLVDHNMLHLDDQAFPILGLAPNPPANVDHSELNTITVQQLLQMSAGFSDDGCTGCLTVGDPMGTPDTFSIEMDQNLQTGVCTQSQTAPFPVTCGKPPTCAQAIQWMLAKPDAQTLLYPPGDVADYSNFSYCVLGALIEKVTGTDYGTWITNNLMIPSGANDMHLATTLGTQDREVTYYDPNDSPTQSVFDELGLAPPVPPQYGNFYFEGNLGNAGWIGSTVDLLRWMATVDGRNGKQALLSSQSQSDMVKDPLVPDINIQNGVLVQPFGPPGPGNLGDGSTEGNIQVMGWFLDATTGNWSHAGGLQGTATEMVHTPDGFGFAAFVNASVPNQPDLSGALATAFTNAGGASGDWYSGDLFDQYGAYTPWMTWSAYQSYFDNQVTLGHYPSRVEGIDHTGTPLFRAVFVPFKGSAWQSFHDMDCLSYQQTASSLSSQGYQNVSLQSYVRDDGLRRYQGTWVKWSSCSPTCTSGSACASNADCQSGVCTNGTCAPPVCAPTCGVGTHCGSNADCASGNCVAGQCTAPSCAPSCPLGAPCNNAGDCESFVCTAGKCAAPSCASQPGKCQVGSPCGASSDCGSKICASGKCQPPSCSPMCGAGLTCSNNGDCASFVCGANLTCQSPSCVSQPNKCDFGAPCGVGSDCGSGICVGGKCQHPSCFPTCADNTPCGDNGECGSVLCTNAKCHAPSCSPTCGTGLNCGANSDCRSGVCTNGFCK